MVWPITRSAAFKPLGESAKLAAASSLSQNRIDDRASLMVTGEAPRQPIWIVKNLSTRRGWAMLRCARAEPWERANEILFLFLETNHFSGSGIGAAPHRDPLEF